MKLSTRRLSELLQDTEKWDEKYQELCHAQTEWLLDSFCFGDDFCAFVDAVDRRRWEVPKVVQGRLYTVCDG
jgi:hypothetical protein